MARLTLSSTLALVPGFLVLLSEVIVLKWSPSGVHELALLRFFGLSVETAAGPTSLLVSHYILNKF